MDNLLMDKNLLRRVVVLLLAVSCVVHADPSPWTCEGRKDLKGECTTVRGRLKLYNGGPPNARIWTVGTRRLLGVEQREGDRINVPAGLMQWIGFETTVFADFLVCPLTPDVPGEMRLVCVESASNIYVERYTTGRKEPERFFSRPVVRSKKGS